MSELNHPPIHSNPNAEGGAMPSEQHEATAADPHTGAAMTEAKHADDAAHTDSPNGALMTGQPPDDFDEPIPDTVRMLTPYDVARAALTGIGCELGLDEVRVLVRIGERLKAGRSVYGRLHLATDPRTFRSKEAREELEDALVYLACAWLKAETKEVA